MISREHIKEGQYIVLVRSPILYGKEIAGYSVTIDEGDFKGKRLRVIVRAKVPLYSYMLVEIEPKIYEEGRHKKVQYHLTPISYVETDNISVPNWVRNS